MTRLRPIAGLAVFLLINLLIVLLLRDRIAGVAGLYDRIPAAAVWMDMQHAGLLYLLTPLIVLAACVILLAPGTLIILAGGKASDPGELLLKGFGLSFMLHLLTGSIAKLLLANGLQPEQFLTLLVATLVASFGYLLLRARQHANLLQVFTAPGNASQLAWVLAIPFLFVIPLLPALFWQDLNADGFEAMEMGRSLSHALLPVFPEPAGTMGLGNGKLPLAYPIHWFIMLFGPTEAATRLPMALYLMVLFPALLTLINHQAVRTLRWGEQTALMVAIAGYTVATCFSSGYDNYFCDISSPAAFDTLTIVLIVGSIYFLWIGSHSWFLLFTVLGFLARPTLLLVVVLMGIGIYFAAPERKRASLVMISTTIGIWLALLIGYEHWLLPLISDGQSTPYSSSSIIGRYHYLTVTDLQRLLYAAAPVGLLPALSLFAWRWQDPLSRCITVVSVGYFMAFYFPAFTSLHHFVPAMILPLIVLWRVVAQRSHNPATTFAITASAAAMLWLSLPQHFDINRTFRAIGARTAYLIGDYRGDFRAYRESMSGTSLIDSFFHYDWNVPDPAKELVGGYQLTYYAHSSGPVTADINYLMLPPGATAPVGFSLLTSDQRGSAWVRDTAQWDADRLHPPTTEYRSWLYRISRETSFDFAGIPARNYDINLGSVPLLWRIFPEI